MPEALTMTLTAAMTPVGVGASVTVGYSLTGEQHARSLTRQIVIPAAQVDFPIPLTDFATVAAIVMSTNQAFTYKLGATNRTAITCRKMAVHTPNSEVIGTIYVTTTQPIILNLMVSGD